MTLLIDNQQTEVAFTQDIQKLLEACAEKALAVKKIDFPVEISVVLVNNEEIRRVNREFRGIDRATDVLSFPMLEFDGDEAEFSLQDFELETDPESQEVVLGDIVISLEKAREQAIEYGHSFERELGFLMVHGMLHLLGHDHEREEDARVMRKLEEEILASLSLVRE